MKYQSAYFLEKLRKKIINLSSAEFAHRVVYKIQTYKIQKRKSIIHTWITNWKKMLNTYHVIGQLSRMSNSYFFLFSLENRSFLSPGDNLHEISICLLHGKIMKKFISLSSAEFAHRLVYKIQTYKIQLKRKSKIHTWVTNWKHLPCNGQIQQMSNSYFFFPRK